MTRTYYKLYLYFAPRSQEVMYWYSDKPLRSRREVVEECVREMYLPLAFSGFVTASLVVSRVEYLETMWE